MPASISSSRPALLELAKSGGDRISISPETDGARVKLKSPELEFLHSFVSGPYARRARQSKQALLKACNNKQRTVRHTLDLTAGWGLDAFILASHGQRVTLLEYQPLVHAIVAYALERLQQTVAGAEVASRMQLQHLAAMQFFDQLPLDHDIDCIYIDPMFAAHKSGAKPGKEMQVLQVLTENLELEACFERALETARKRVVVKRPAKAAAFADASPDLVYREKTIRFDVYLRS